MVDPEVERLLREGKVKIKLYNTKKSNTALASTLLLATTGIFVYESKEEKEVVDTHYF